MDETEEKIIKAVDAILEGDYKFEFEDNSPVSEKVRELIRVLSIRSQEEMSRVVALSVEANETAIFSAQMLYNLQKVDQKAQAIAAASEEMTSTVNEIGNYGKNISEQAKTAQEATHEGARVSSDAKQRMEEITFSVAETSKRVSSLNELSNNISSILESIKKIAGQTNLLALNATIEAARAGEAGKGFAVVASEVKNLSTQTAESTEEIAHIIQKLQEEMRAILTSMDQSSEAVKNGETAIENLSEKMEVIRATIDEVSSNTENISHTLSQQAEASSEVAQGISDIATSSSESVKGIGKIVDAMNAVEKLITAQINELAKLNVPAKVVKLAQSDHVIWKKRLANMVAGREGLNANELADHHSCRLGKWYDAVNDPKYKNNEEFKRLVDPHKVVHEHGIQAVNYFNDGNTEKALEEIAKVEEASKDVLSLLGELEAVES